MVNKMGTLHDIDQVNLKYVEHLPEVGTPVLKKALDITIRIAEAQRLLGEALYDANQFEAEICGNDKERQWSEEEIIAAKTKAGLIHVPPVSVTVKKTASSKNH